MGAWITGAVIPRRVIRAVWAGMAVLQHWMSAREYYRRDQDGNRIPRIVPTWRSIYCRPFSGIGAGAKF
ncbi:MAG: hypothetical protein CMF64_06175 [Magnetovibrio sp.]|nr:hypothetical protein [Magnetovibrio sp.]